MAGMRVRKATSVARSLARLRKYSDLSTFEAKPIVTPDAFLDAVKGTPDRPSYTNEGFFDDDLPRTYSGLLDDVMLRYSDDFLGEAFFNKMILKNVLFGGGMYLNDGYLVNHPVARRYLRDDDSLLRVMISTGFIRILTRTNSPEALYKMPYDMATNNNTSFKQLVASNEWAAMRPLYARLTKEIFRSGNNRSWPAFNMSAGFTKLIKGIFDRAPSNLGLQWFTEDQLSQLEAEFNALNPEEGNARHKFEEAAKKVVEEERSRMAEIMSIANQAYHYNFGLTLTEEDIDGVAVDTTVGMAFDELLNTREIVSGQLDDFPLAHVPDNMPFDDGDLFRPFLQYSHGIGALKMNYLGALDRLLGPNATQISDLRKDARAATDEYLSAIRELFEAKIGRLATETIFSDAIVMGVGSLDPTGVMAKDAIIATSAPTAALAVSLQSQATAQKRQFMVERFRLVNADADFSMDRTKVVTLRDLRPQIASLAFNPARAKEFIQGLPLIKS